MVSRRSGTVGSALAVVVVLATGCEAARDDDGPPDGVSPVPSTSVSQPAACPESGVRITSTGSDAAMGLRALGLELVNCGERPYQLNGYPALRVLDEQREPIMLRVVNGAKEITSGFDQPPRPVTLQTGERATAAVLWRNLVTEATAPASNGEFLLVAPVAGQPATEVDPDGPIDLGTTGRIGVSAWQKADPAAPVPTQPAPPPVPSAPPSTTSPPDGRL
ncbi:DUF4232 domain-containing protein [Micromonospora vulcania]|uniref:DUF4232 domain-containing protein n=1 Tax=Micromonospora vulcania TaxID=1441873 RepID=A0ABW1H9U7_9ACTN